MKHTEISYEVQRLELKHSWNLSRGSWDFKENVIVRLTREGISGWGEAAPNSRYDETPESTVALVEKAAEGLAALHPAEYVRFGEAIQQLGDGQTAAKAALDMALMDWVGKSFKTPLHRFWGLSAAETPITTLTIGIDTPEVIREKVNEAKDFPILKIKLGSRDDREIIAAVRAVTDKPLCVDANEGWKDRETALRNIKWLAGENVVFVEQPMPAAMLDDIAWVRQRASLPLIADESVKQGSEIPQLAAAFDGINIKVMKSGGLQEALRMIWMAKTLGLKVMLGCMVETSLGISAAAALSPLVDYADLDGHLLIKNDPYRGIAIDGGKIVLNDMFGVGVVER